MPIKKGFRVAGTVASGSSVAITVPAGEVWWPTYIYLSQYTHLGLGTSNYNYAQLGPNHDSNNVTEAGLNQYVNGKLRLPMVDSPAPYVSTFGGSGSYTIGGVCLDEAEEGYTVHAEQALPDGAYVTLLGAVPAGTARLIVHWSSYDSGQILLVDTVDAVRSLFLRNATGDTLEERSMKALWQFDDSPFQGVDAYGSLDYTTIVYLEYADASVLDEYQNRVCIKQSVLANSSYDIRPPAGESWAIDFFAATQATSNWYMVDGAGTETLLFAATDANPGVGGPARQNHTYLLFDDWYLRLTTGVNADTVRAQGVKDRL